MTITNVGILLVIIQALLASPSFVAFINVVLNRRRNTSSAKRDDASAVESGAKSIRLLLDPLNERINTLETQLAAFANREVQLKLEREERERRYQAEFKESEERHTAEVTGLKTVQAVMQSEIDELRGGVAVLAAQLEGAGIMPRWKPKPKTGPLVKT